VRAHIDTRTLLLCLAALVQHLLGSDAQASCHTEFIDRQNVDLEALFLFQEMTESRRV